MKVSENKTQVCLLCECKTCQLQNKIDNTLVLGINEENIEEAVQLREIIKHREDVLRNKRQELDKEIYNNIRLLTERTSEE
jgi:thioredoxin reductase